MKKFFTLTMLVMAVMSGYAQANLFDVADCDANGWLWFDSDAKISKYVGNANDKTDSKGFDWENYTVNPKGKPIQLAFGNISPDYPDSYADATFVGTDAAGYVEGQEQYVPGQAKTGAIVLASASAMMSPNGGCLILNLPSCSTISLYMSSESSYMGRTLMITPGYNMSIDDSEAGADPWTGHTKSIYSKATMFSPLHKAGQFQWDTAATDHGSTNGDLNFVSTTPVYFAFQNCRNAPIYIHGIKVTLGTSAGISDVNAQKNGKAEYFTLDGRRVEQAAHGLTIVRQNGVVRKVLK